MQNIILYFGQQELKKKICTRGGTGRRARFRSVWINLRGSSNLLACTMKTKSLFFCGFVFLFHQEFTAIQNIRKKAMKKQTDISDSRAASRADGQNHTK